MEEEKLSKKARRDQRKEEKQQKKEAEQQKAKRKTTFAWVVGVAVIALIVYAIARSVMSPEEEQVAKGADLKTPVTADEHIKGNPDASVTLVEYADFQCPACAAYHPMLQEVFDVYQDRVRFVYRHLPLTRIHDHAELTAYASEAAANQSKFWEMHDKIYANQSVWSKQSDPRDTLIEYARDLGLNEEQFIADLDSADVKARVQDDVVSANQARLNSTPSFFINGERIINPQSSAQFGQLLDEALEKAAGEQAQESSEEVTEEDAADGVDESGEASETSEESNESQE
jgi:protein-disulfide isomerase